MGSRTTIVVTLLLLSVHVPVHAEDCVDYGGHLRWLASAPWGGGLDPPHAVDVAWVGDHICTLDPGRGLIVTDAGDPRHPSVVRTLPLAGEEQSIDVAGSLAFVGTRASGVHVIDVADPALATLLATLPIEAPVEATAVVDGRLYVAGGTVLWLADIGDPAAPALVSTFYMGGNILDLCVLDDLLLVAHRFQGLLIFSLAGPDPVQIGALVMPGGARRIAAVTGPAHAPAALVGFGDDVLRTVDLAMPSQPRVLGEIAVPAPVEDIDTAPGQAVVSLGPEGLWFLDVSVPATPDRTGRMYIADPLWGNSLGVAVSANRLAWAASYLGLQIVELNDYRNVPVLGRFQADDEVWDVAVDDVSAHLAVYTKGFAIADVTDPTHPTLLYSNDLAGTQRMVERHGSQAYVGWSTTLGVFGVANPGAATLQDFYHFDYSAHGMTIESPYLYAAITDHGLEIVDISNPRQLGRVSTVLVSDDTQDVAVAAGHAFVSTRSSIDVVDVSDATQPRFLGSIAGRVASARSVAASGDYLYATQGIADLEIIDIGDPLAAHTVGVLDLPPGSYDVVIDGEVAYVANGHSGVIAVDVSDPTAPFVLGYVQMSGETRGVDVRSSRVYAADGAEGLAIGPAHCDSRTPVEPIAEQLVDAMPRPAPQPNPFLERTIITFTMPAGGDVEMRIYDLAGRRVRQVMAGPLPRGLHERAWDGRDDAGRTVAAGIYFCRLRTPWGTGTAKLAMVR